MGYRTYIAEMPKKEYNKIKSLTKQEMFDFYKLEAEDDEEPYKSVSDFGEELYEFGKYTDFQPPFGSHLPFFKKQCLQDYYEEHDFEVVTKEFLAYIIGTYKDKIKEYYNDMVTPFFGKKGDSCDIHKPCDFLNTIKVDYNYPNNNYTFDFSKITQEEQNALHKMIEHVKGCRTEWAVLTPFNLENGDSVTTSWKYEYEIFEMIRIYKSFDWKKNVMIYYGH